VSPSSRREAFKVRRVIMAELARTNKTRTIKLRLRPSAIGRALSMFKFG
jgi:hypothetical protein